MLSEPAERVEYEDAHQDKDSLFGSPPPSPRARGRSPSPALALPSTPNAGSQTLSFCSAAQNVGTIALPGSHINSEPPVNSLAPSLSLPGGSCNPFLPQPLTPSLPQARQSSIGRSEPPSLIANRSRTSVLAHLPPQETRRSGPKQKSKSATPRPPPPVIPLPDPSQPPPSHFLRNQQALLGHAGLIAGVKPSKLTTLSGTSRGASPSNPIVLDDNEGSESSKAKGRSYIEYFKNIDRSTLPKPTCQEVVDMLIKQGDIFPVLQSILNLLAGGAAPAASTPPGTLGYFLTPVQAEASSHPPMKRRKLNRVPAGAADWDVPYPFMDGEGPRAYRQNWLQERGRQLISQVIGLVKIAMEKAAAKKHIERLESKKRRQKEEERAPMGLGSREGGGKGAKHYRAEINLPRRVTSPSVEESSSNPPQTPKLSPIESPEPAEPPASTSRNNTAFNDLLSALLSTSGTNNATPSDPTPLSAIPSSDSFMTSHQTNDILSTFDLFSAPNEIVDQSLLDSWMNILQTFPQPTEGFDSNTKPTLDGASLESLLGIDTPSDFSAFASPSGQPSSFSTTPIPDAQTTRTLDQNSVGNLDTALSQFADQSRASTDFIFSLPSTSGAFTTENQTRSPPIAEPAPMNICELPVEQLNTSQIDKTNPNLSSAINIDHIKPQSSNFFPTRVSQVSRLTSSRAKQTSAPSKSTRTHSSTFLPSPVSSLAPVTPISAGVEMSLPEAVAGNQSQAQGTWWEEFLASMAATDSVGSQGTPAHLPMQDVGVGSGPQDDPGVAGKSASNATLTKSKARRLPPVPRGQAFASTSATPVATQRSVRRLKKADVLKKAEERRAQLKARLEDLKVKLWETTIEHGALLQLMRLTGAEQSTSLDS